MSIYVLDDILNNDKFSNEVISEKIDQVDAIDRDFFRKIVYGVVENLIYLDYIINKLSKIPLKKLDKNVLNILRIAVYEIVFLDKERYAVINEAVKNAKKIKFKSSGFVNGILRNLDRNLDKFLHIDLEFDEMLSVKYSTNIDIIKYLKEYYSNYEDIVKTFVQTPKLNIRINSMLTTRDELKKKLEKYGLNVSFSEISKDSLIIKNPKEITELREFEEGLFTIQDQSSALVSEILNPKENSLVLDLCAAPGSKSTHLLQIMNDNGKIISNDIAIEKISKIQENFNRMKLKNYEITNYDASEYIEEFNNKFDYVLVDAPCSGLGVIKRKPEIKLNRKKSDIIELAKLQEKILDNAYNYLKVGGNIVYSTCTLGALENENIVNKFKNKFSDIEFEKINDKNYITIMPDEENDGFFICKMLKV